MCIVQAHTHIYLYRRVLLPMYWLFAKFTQARVAIWEEIFPIDWPVGNAVRVFLIDDWFGRSQVNVGDMAPQQVVMGYIKKHAEKSWGAMQ